MIDPKLLQDYVDSPGFRQAMDLPAGTALSLAHLGQGEYNANYSFIHPITGRKLVLRINTGSQMHLDDQIGYEFRALQALRPSGRTPEPVFCDSSRAFLPYGAMVMEWLPGRPLRYERDLPEGAAILADIHAVPVPEDSCLIAPDSPALAIYQECLDMVEHYWTWEESDRAVCRLLEQLVEQVGRLPLDAPPVSPRCMVNTELNSGNFLIREEGPGYLVDWEKPLLSEPAQDLGHFLAPTTTFWKTDTVLSPEEMGAVLGCYGRAVGGRLDLTGLVQRLPMFFAVTCLRGVTWCAMALREYAQPGRALSNPDTLHKLRQYVDTGFLTRILEDYVRRDIWKGVVVR